MMVRLIRKKFFMRDLVGVMNSTAVMVWCGGLMAGSMLLMETVEERFVQPDQVRNLILVDLISELNRTLGIWNRPLV